MGNLERGIVSMWEEFKRGYDGPPLPTFIGSVIGLCLKWSMLTVVVVLTARAVGVQV